MLTEETLCKLEVWQSQHRVYPVDVWKRFLHTMSGQSVIQHNLTTTDIAVSRDLPEYCGTLPML